MRTHAARRRDPDLIVDKQVPNVTQLANNHCDPIDSHKEIVHSERGWMGIALPKNSAARMKVTMVPWVVGDMIGIVECWNDAEQPCGESQDAVPEDVCSRHFPPAGKWVIECHLNDFVLTEC